MSYQSRIYRQRNPKMGEEPKGAAPFFQSPKGAAMRKKKTGTFFQKEEGAVQRRIATSKEDEKLSTNDARMEKDKEDPVKPVYRKHKNDERDKEAPSMGGGVIRKKEGRVASAQVSGEIEQQAGKGSPLPAKTLAEMSRSFGMDFSDVRVHHDDAAAQLCIELNALAFTHGMDIYFNEGRYNPESEEGKLLLAHELTHVAQQYGHRCYQ